MESYAHKAAKSVVVGWLRDAAREAGRDGYVDTLGIQWRVNRDGPHWGVWEEYPVLADGTGLDPVWDEDCGPEFDSFPRDRPPTFDELRAVGRVPKAILDIAIQHKGIITTGIEIVHKHPCAPDKCIFLRSFCMNELIELPTAWVLGQIKRPDKIPDRLWLSPWRPSPQERENAIRFLEDMARS